MEARSLLVACYALALATVIALWWFVSPDMINSMFDFGENLAGATGRGLARLVGVDPVVGETLVIERAHGERTIVIGVFMLPWFALLTYLAGGDVLRNLGSVIVAILVVHLVIDILWIGLTSWMSAWYGMHTWALKGIFRVFMLHRTETLIMRALQPQSLLVLGEAIFVYALIARRLTRNA